MGPGSGHVCGIRVSAGTAFGVLLLGMLLAGTAQQQQQQQRAVLLRALCWVPAEDVCCWKELVHLTRHQQCT